MDQSAQQPTPNVIPESEPSSQPAQPLQAPVIGQSAFNAQQPLPVQAPKKKRWIVPLIIIVLLALVGGACAYYFIVFQKPENVLRDAYNNLVNAKAVQSDGVVTYNKSMSNDVVFKDIQVKTNMRQPDESGQADVTVNMEMKGKKVAFGGKAIGTLANDGEMYFQLNNVKDSMKTIVEAQGASESDMPAGFYDSLTKIQDQWVKVTLADLKKSNQSNGKDMECAINVLKKHQNNYSQQFIDAYKKAPFVTVKDKLGTKDKAIGYKLAVDTAKEKDFAKAIEETSLGKDLKACNFESNSSESSPIDTPKTDDMTYSVWIDQWSHTLKKVEMSGDTGTGSDKMNINGTATITYDAAKKIEIPSTVISLDEFQKRAQAVYDTLGVSSPADLQETSSASYAL